MSEWGHSRRLGDVAMEMVTGKLDGKSGSFALQHVGTMDASGQNLEISVVPGSGTGELIGIAARAELEAIAAARPARAS